MTDYEYYKICVERLKYSPHSDKGSQNLFLRTLKNNPKAQKEAHAYFRGFDQTYLASSDTLVGWVILHKGGSGSLNTKTRLEQDIRRNKKKK